MVEIKRWKLKLYNLHYDKPPKDVVYVGRPTTFGNPFTHLDSSSTKSIKVKDRATAVASYKKYLKQNLIIAKLARKQLKGKSLSCWCCPHACHAEVLMDVANEPGPEEKRG